jgi:hypothetical protein
MDGVLPHPKLPQPESFPEITMTPDTGNYIGGTLDRTVSNVPAVQSAGASPSPPGAGEVGSGVPNPELYHEDFETPGAAKDNGQHAPPSGKTPRKAPGSQGQGDHSTINEDD